MGSILAVDNSTESAELLKTILERGGIEVTMVEDGEAALTAYEEGDFDVVITEIFVQPVDGFTLLRRLRKLDKNAIVILMSEEASKEIAIKSFQSGAFGFQEKPFDQRNLIKDVNRAVQTRQMRASKKGDPAELERLESRKLELLEERERALEEKMEAAEKMQHAVEESQNILQDREAFLKESEEKLMGKSQMLIETETELEQLREDLMKGTVVPWNQSTEKDEGPEPETEIIPDVDFSEDEKKLLYSIFEGFSAVDFMKLMHQVEWRDYEVDSLIVEEGQTVTTLFLIFDGTARVSKGDKEIAILKEHDFIGDMGFTSRLPASATVTAAEPSRLVAWTIMNLNETLDGHPTLRASLHAVIGAGLVRKLTGSNS